MFARTAFAALGMVGAFALGVAVGPHMQPTPAEPARAPAPAVVSAPEIPAPAAAPVRRATPRATRAERLPDATAPAVQRSVTRLLNKGSDPSLAAAGFTDASQLIAVAHAARNTEIPFVLLKHRVLEQKMTLAQAIAESRPDLDETAEASRARAGARADLAALAD